jgi:hypothetical protein
MRADNEMIKYSYLIDSLGTPDHPSSSFSCGMFEYPNIDLILTIILTATHR